jgi:formylglycine-generating enzyme required for sulfatase activity
MRKEIRNTHTYNSKKENKMYSWLNSFFLASLLIATNVYADAYTVTSVDHNGRITWTNQVNSTALYRVEWASEPSGPWSSTLNLAGGSDFRNGGAWTNTSFSSKIPMFYRITEITERPPRGMVFIPGGTFRMGDVVNDNNFSDNKPVRNVTVDSFWMARTETTRAEWMRVMEWGLQNGYTFDNTNSFKAMYCDYPVQARIWYDVLKFCNAKSEMEGRQPVYWCPVGMFAVTYKTGIVEDVSFWFDRNGYRLPTEAEWEYAARSGLDGKRFPYGNTISHYQEKYYSQGTFDWDQGPSRGINPSYPGSYGAGPVAGLAPNGYGLFDMVANVAEYCWDRYASDYYSWGETNNPTGPSITSYTDRVHRGILGNQATIEAPIANRWHYDPRLSNLIGFRLVVSYTP